MGWFIHHVNIQAFDVRESADFYRNIIGLRDGVWVYPEQTGDVGHNPDSIAPFGSLNRGIHVVKAIPEFPRKNGLFHNPTIGGHFAITTTDVDRVKARLEGAGYIVSDAGEYAMAGMRQIYAYDPFQNVIEINETINASAGPAPAADEAHGIRMEDGDWYIHHVNLPAHRVPETTAYFRDLIGLKVSDWITADKSPIADFVANGDNLVTFGDDNRGIHVVKPSPDFAQKNGFHHNPTIGGHFALTVKDLDAIAGRMSKAGILFTDAGSYAMAGLRQLYAYDPSMNLVEINQPV
jgi:catechol 2,3-dioxygenase-like lactoylglutathione lyase family enzyme